MHSLGPIHRNFKPEDFRRDLSMCIFISPIPMPTLSNSSATFLSQTLRNKILSLVRDYSLSLLLNLSDRCFFVYVLNPLYPPISIYVGVSRFHF